MADVRRRRVVRIDPDLDVRIEKELERLGGLPFERWARLAFEMAIPDGAKRSKVERQPGPNVENIRSSAQAKRSVAPIPKGHQ